MQAGPLRRRPRKRDSRPERRHPCSSPIAGSPARPTPLGARQLRATAHGPKAAVSSVPATPPARSKAATLGRTRTCMLLVHYGSLRRT
jgi:hypothetical protein